MIGFSEDQVFLASASKKGAGDTCSPLVIVFWTSQCFYQGVQGCYVLGGFFLHGGYLLGKVSEFPPSAFLRYAILLRYLLLVGI